MLYVLRFKTRRYKVGQKKILKLIELNREKKAKHCCFKANNISNKKFYQQAPRTALEMKLLTK